MAVIWIFGNSGAGKTTLARALRTQYSFVHLDGNELREVWQLGFSREDRYEQNLRTARLAALLEGQGYAVVVTLICPYEDLRQQIDAICRPAWFYLPGGHAPTDDYPFEVPSEERAVHLAPIPGEGNVEKVAAALERVPFDAAQGK